jgi:hypothetical protein
LLTTLRDIAPLKQPAGVDSMNTETLSFVTRTADGLDYWSNVEESGDWGSDNARGEDCAREMLRFQFFHDAPMIFGYVLKAMIAKGRFGGVEVGFANTISLIAEPQVSD